MNERCLRFEFWDQQYYDLVEITLYILRLTPPFYIRIAFLSLHNPFVTADIELEWAAGLAKTEFIRTMRLRLRPLLNMRVTCRMILSLSRKATFKPLQAKLIQSWSNTRRRYSILFINRACMMPQPRTNCQLCSISLFVILNMRLIRGWS